MEHTEQCLKEFAKYKIRYDAWIAEWPNYCRECNGAGEHHWIENGAPHGAGFWSMPMSEFCENCVGVGKCSHCGAPDMIDTETGDGPCSACGWNYDDECPLEYPDGPCNCQLELIWP